MPLYVIYNRCCTQFDHPMRLRSDGNNLLTVLQHLQHLNGFDPISAIADRRSSSTGSSQLSALSAVASLRAPCSGRCCSCSTLPTWVSSLPVSAYRTTSTLMTLSFTRGDLHQQ